MEKQPVGFFGYIIRFINCIFIFGLLGSYCAQWISPETFWPVAFLGIAYPVFAIVNLIFLIHWIFRKRKFLIYPLISLMVGLPMVGRFIQFGSNSEIVDANNDIKLVSYNVHVLDYYQNKFGVTGYARDKIIEKMKLEDADIYCMQEFYPKDKKGNKITKMFTKGLETPYKYSDVYMPYTNSVHNAIFSKFPIVAKGQVKAGYEGESIGAIYADIEIDNSKIRVYSVHLKSIRISGEKDVIGKLTNIDTPQGQETAKEQSMKMINKFKIAFAERAKQIAIIKEHISNSPYSVIIAGDFNDTPSSYAYKQLRGDLDDAFVENGSGMGQTYIGPYPSFRIDNIFYDPQFTCNKYNTIDVKLSDHYPISAEFSLD